MGRPLGPLDPGVIRGSVAELVNAPLLLHSFAPFSSFDCPSQPHLQHPALA